MDIIIKEYDPSYNLNYRVIYIVGYYFSVYRSFFLRDLKSMEKPQTETCYIAFVGDNPVGICGFNTREEYGRVEMEELVVLPDHRRRGVGRKLIESLVEHARVNDIHNVSASIPYGWFEQDEELFILLEIYEKLGFEMVGVGVWIRTEEDLPRLVEVVSEKDGVYHVYERDLGILAKKKFQLVKEFGKNYNLVKKV